MNVLFRVSVEELRKLNCRFHPHCNGAPVGIFHVPEGCNCWQDQLQALCAQHAVKVHSTGPVTKLLDFKIFTRA
jgi:hypothetical protein